MKNAFSFILGLLCLSVGMNSHAASRSESPCPKVENIINVELIGEDRGAGTWSFYAEHSFGTKLNWLFGITLFHSVNDVDARNKVKKKALPTLRSDGQDILVGGVMWLCGYDIDLDGSVLMMQKVN